jgi:hypothetical protein
MNWEKKILLIGYTSFVLAIVVGICKRDHSDSRTLIPIIEPYQFVDEMLKYSFSGTWMSNSTAGFLSSREGNIYAGFFRFDSKDELSLRVEKDNSYYLKIIALDPQFLDEHFITIIQPIKIENSTNILFDKVGALQRLTMNEISYSNFLEFSSASNINFDGNFTFNSRIFFEHSLNISALESIEPAFTVNLTDSRAGGFRMEINLSFNKFDQFRASLFYTLFMVSIAALNYYGAISIFEKINESPNYTKRMNQSTIILVSLQDCFIFILNMQIGYLYLETWCYVIVTAIYFALFCFVDYRILLLTWRYQNSRFFDELTESQFRSYLYTFQMKIYFLILCYIYLMFKYFINVNFVFLNALVVIPQIVHHIRSGNPPFFESKFLIFFSSSKYLIFMYLRGCSENLLGIRFYYALPSAGLAVVLVSLAILYFQGTYGSKFFIPKYFKKDEFNYFIAKKEAIKTESSSVELTNMSQSTTEEHLCCICMVDISQSLSNDNSLISHCDDIQNKIIKRMIKRKENDFLMVTPCKHFFHPSCLGKWMEIKMECPQCRQLLPSVG